MRALHAPQKGLMGAVAVALALAASWVLPAVADAEGGTITAPSSGAFVASPVTVSGTVESGLLESVTEVTIKVYPGTTASGSPREATSSVVGGTWSATLGLPEGANTAVAEFNTLLPPKVSEPVTFYVDGPPHVTQQPSNTTADAGGSAQFTASASGTPNPAIQWEVSTNGGVSWSPDSTDSGTTGETLTVSSVNASQNGDLYRAVFSNGEGSVTSSPAELIVDSPPSVTLNPSSEVISAGGEAKFSAAASGNPEPSLQWEVSKDGGASWGAYGSAHSTTLSIGGVGGGMNGWQFRAAFSNSLATVDSGAATLTVNEGPHITLSPSDQTVVAGNTVSFSASAEGTPAPTVRWEVSNNNGTTWSPAPPPNTESTLTFTANAGESGNLYRAVFENGSGSATTSAARLLVESPPAVTRNPSSETVLAGGQAEFSSEASGNPQPGIQWEYSSDGGASWNAYEGAHGTTLLIGSVKASMNGWEFRAVFSNSLATVESSAATLTVNESAHVISSPKDQTAIAGHPVSFAASGAGTPPLTVRWEVSTDNGANWSLAPPPNNESTLTFTASASESGNLYRAVFENNSGSEATAPARLTVEVPPTVTVNPQNVTLPTGERAEFTAAATGSPPPGVQWQYSTNSGATWISIPGATSPTYKTPPVSPSQSGYEYRALFSNAAGETPSAAALLTVHEGPHVTRQPAAKTVIAGSPASFTAEATGFPAPAVQWEVSANAGATWARDTTDTGNTADTMTILVTTANENGYLYRATFTNLTGSVTTQAAKLEVQTKPTVTVAPPKVVIAAGAKAHFTATVNGYPPPSLAWQYQPHGATSWTALSGASKPELTIPVQSNYDGIKFRAVATNAVATVDSEPSEVELSDQPQIQLQPEPKEVPVGDPAEFKAKATGNPVPTAEWQVFSNGSWARDTADVKPPVIEGAEVTTSLVLSHTSAAQNGEAVRVIFSNGIKPNAESNAAKLTVETAPVVTQQPVSATVPSGETAFFTATAGGTPPPSVQWEESSNGATWSPIAGAGTTTLTLPGASAAMNGRLYRAVFTNPLGKAESEAARLTVVTPAPPAHGPPAASFSWLPTTPRVGESVSLVATASDAFSAITGYAWNLSGASFVPGASTLTTIFATPGPHAVSLRVSAADGQTTTVTKAIPVAPKPISLIQPFPIVRIAGVVTPGGARVRLLSVRAPRGAMVSIACIGRGCPIKKQVRSATSRVIHSSVLTLLFPRFERSFPGGTVLQVRVSYPGEIGKYTSLHIRRGHLPIRADACLNLDGVHPIGCPAR